VSKNAEKRKREKERRREAVIARSLHDTGVKQAKREEEVERAEQTFDSKPDAR
jgi:hypothetical protein